jgi:hypothetical protein
MTFSPATIWPLSTVLKLLLLFLDPIIGDYFSNRTAPSSPAKAGVPSEYCSCCVWVI